MFGKKFILDGVILFVGLIFAFWLWKINFSLWLPILLLIFFIGLRRFFEYRHIKSDKENRKDSSLKEGVLSSFIVDGDPSYGLYFRLLGELVFIDIRKDDLIEEREIYAQRLFCHAKDLEVNLEKFLIKNPGFLEKKISYIGLHSEDQFVGEVFWSPSGYTSLKDLNFVD